MKYSAFLYFWLKILFFFIGITFLYFFFIEKRFYIENEFNIHAVFISFFVNLIDVTGSIAKLKKWQRSIIVGISLFSSLSVLAILTGLSEPSNVFEQNFGLIWISIPLISMLWILLSRTDHFIQSNKD